ncbi:hypothetical protein SEUCBS139899_006489 [Sporothrix eucalyptigena]|uniref:Chalcone isomerase domain-containing protein n=1 Tax=Sporothrix eucalyptigena TaxID=1812306 RepID=A0ABP0CJR2_9PEZI
MLQRIAVRAACGRQLFSASGRGSSATSTGGHIANLANPRAAFQRRTLIRSADSGGRSREEYDTLNVAKMARQRREYDRTWLIFLATGSLVGIIATGYTGWRIKELMEQNPKKLDATGTPQAGEVGARKVVVHDKDGREIVPTGNKTITEFPRTVDLPLKLVAGTPSSAIPSSDPAAVIVVPPTDGSDGPGTEYTLVGLGTRTVSFLRFEVYVVGFYVATADIAALQNRLIKRVNPIATALVSGEKTELRSSLVDANESQAIWDALLEEGIPERSLFRIVPVRDTDFPHLRDGFMRAIKAQSTRILANEPEGTAKANFGESMHEFRHIFNRGKAKKGRELLIIRGADGALSVVFDDGRSFGRELLGSVGDERVSRSLWLNYLGGASVASEAARQSIADGLVEFVERPVGTVAAQVV